MNEHHPKSVLLSTSLPGFHGKISRDQSESLLKNGAAGLYLIRESNHFPGDYTLCLASPEQTVEHYHILGRSHNGGTTQLTIDEEVYFDSLLQLVEHYQEDADGLVCKLSMALDSSETVIANENDFRKSGWRIDLDEVQLDELIGKGEFSEVYKGFYNGHEIAVKKIKDKSLKNLFIAEASLMTTLNHPNLVHLLGVVFEADDSVYLVTEFMSKGSLVDYLKTRGRAIIMPQDQIRYAKDICCGMAYMEERKFVHRDLAARNVLLNELGLAKVSDFGLALSSETLSQRGDKLPVKWTAPEALKHKKFTTKSDVWSFGILLWEIYSFGRVPYPRIPLAEVENRLANNYRMTAPEGCPLEIYSIMQETWQWQAEKRPTFQAILTKLIDLCSTTV